MPRAARSCATTPITCARVGAVTFDRGIPVERVLKVHEGRPNCMDMIVNGEIALVVNTVEEKRSAIQDSYVIRRAALNAQVPTYTTIAGARAAAAAPPALTSRAVLAAGISAVVHAPVTSVASWRAISIASTAEGERVDHAEGGAVLPGGREDAVRGEPGDLRRQDGELVMVERQLLEAGELGALGWQRGELIAVER